jgi:hypothetical protein
MLIRSFQEMLKEYDIEDLASDDKEERIKMLSEKRYSVIFEGDFLEFDNAEKWIQQNISNNPVAFLFYGKLGYDYGFFEFFFTEQKYAIEFTQVIPNLFTTYPIGKTFKTNGYNNLIELQKRIIPD